MQVNIIKLSPWRIPRTFAQDWVGDLHKVLKKRKLWPLRAKEIHLVFVEKEHIQQLNAQYRQKNRPTDILSFSGASEEELGELVLCGEILSLQAREHDMTLKQELGYMLIHGVLHLLGYDHETSTLEAKKMFDLQDEIFAMLEKRHRL